jgi:hypothetical protein
MRLQSPVGVSVMTSAFLSVLRRASVAVAVCAAMVGLASSPAHARVFIGFGFPFFAPGYYPPPVYYPPPMYYAPPTVYAPPPRYSQAPQYSQGPQYSQAPQGGYGQTCSAGPYVCPMEHPTAAGANCYCLGSGGARVWGRAN